MSEDKKCVIAIVLAVVLFSALMLAFGYALKDGARHTNPKNSVF